MPDPVPNPPLWPAADRQTHLDSIRLVPLADVLAALGAKSREDVERWMSTERFPHPIELDFGSEPFPDVREFWMLHELQHWLRRCRVRRALATSNAHRAQKRAEKTSRSLAVRLGGGA
jgi:predicted DNA-binding transcriptional regulator AlpA